MWKYLAILILLLTISLLPHFYCNVRLYLLSTLRSFLLKLLQWPTGFPSVCESTMRFVVFRRCTEVSWFMWQGSPPPQEPPSRRVTWKHNQTVSLLALGLHYFKIEELVGTWLNERKSSRGLITVDFHTFYRFRSHWSHCWFTRRFLMWRIELAHYSCKKGTTLFITPFITKKYNFHSKVCIFVLN